jgi:hypothetical protein
MRKLLQISIIALMPLIYFSVMGNITGEKETPKQNNTTYKPVQISYSPGFKDKFFNAIFNKGYEPWNPYWHEGLWVLRKLDRINELKFDGIQTYAYGDSYYGTFNSILTGDQITHTKDLLDSVDEAGFYGFHNRHKLSQIALTSQRVIYEAENNSNHEDYNYGFTYVNNMSGISTPDSGAVVLKASTNSNSAGWLCDSIYQNLQHSDIFYFDYDDDGDWIIKPRMRIKQSDFSQTDITPVVAVVIEKFNGEVLDSVIIRVNNFRDESGNYAGQYKERYTFLGPRDSLVIKGTQDSLGLNEGWTNIYNISTRLVDKKCAVDFRVYWFDQVDVWLDKVTVDNIRADNLFKGDYNWEIQEEVQNFVSHGTFTFFFNDEIVASNIPCIKYLEDKAKEYNGNQDVKMSYAITNVFNTWGSRNEVPLSFIMLMDIVKPEVFSWDAHACCE